MQDKKIISSCISLLCHFYSLNLSVVLNPVLGVFMISVSNDFSNFVLNKLHNQEIVLTRILHSDTGTQRDVGTTLVKLAVFLILQ